jgi:hypothetical protein
MMVKMVFPPELDVLQASNRGPAPARAPAVRTEFLRKRRRLSREFEKKVAIVLSFAIVVVIDG